jgi:hypothetical protein
VAVNKPLGDNARKGAFKKRSGLDGAGRRDRADQTQQKRWEVHGCEEAGQEEKGSQTI